MRRGTRVGQAYVSVTADGDGINEEIVNSVDEAGPGVERAGDEHGERYGDHFSEGFFARLRRRFGKDISNRLGAEMDKSGDEVGERLGVSVIEGLKARLAGADDLVERLTSKLDADNGKNVARWRGLAKELRLARDEAGRLERSILAIQRAEGLIGRVSGNRRGKDNGLTGIDDWLSGTRFRNNALNILAKTLGGVIHGFERVALLGKQFVENMGKVEEGAGFFTKISAGFGGGGAEGAGLLSKAFSGIAASGPGAVVAIAAVTAALAVMVSVIGALIALLTALVATIASALVGALGVAGGAILAVVAAAGLLVSAFMSMTDAQQHLLSSAFLPIKAEMVGIAQIMLKDLVPAFAIWSKNLQGALLLLAPLASVMGKAFAQAGTIFTAALSGPGFQQFATALGTYLPSIVTRLSSALGSFLNGTLSLFAAIMPYVNQFAGYLAKVAAEFAAWASSAQGQNSIADFVGRALTSLKSLRDFVSSFTGFLARVLFSPQAQNAGNTIFSSLARTFDSFTRKVAAAAANGSLQKWFDDAIKFGSQLWAVIQALGGTFIALYNSGVLASVGKAMAVFANVLNATNVVLGPMINLLGKVLPSAMAVTLGPLNAVANGVIKIGQAIKWALGLVGLGGGSTSQGPNIGGFLSGLIDLGNSAISAIQSPFTSFNLPDPNSLIGSGMNALNATSISSGGFKPPKKWKNPWRKWAESLIKEGPSISAQIRNAILSVNKQAAAGIASAAKASSAGDVQSSLQSLLSSIQTSGAQTVNSAQSALNSAAQSLASATSKGAAKKALKQVKAAQKNLKAALRDQKRINAAAKIIAAQEVVSPARVNALVSGLKVQNATLADYAEARSRVADMLNDANQKLQEAIQLRDDYKNQVAESIKSFGSLLTAQASVIGGIEQALTATDITSNLEDRLAKIKKFQDDLRLLLAQGLSNDAYKQIVDAGVEQGSQFADALLAGGTGAIQNVNSLVGQINGIADSLGSETSSRLYQAGVDAAQGLVDGLTSLSAQLDAAAVALGNSIANAVKRALGIASPSRVLRDMMGYVGDGAVLGLDDQHMKVGNAAARFASKIAVSPEAARYSGSSMTPVSGNQPGWLWTGDIVTPTEDPHAVANEVINELVGRIT